MPVSYTHLDVYKRQLGVYNEKAGSITFPANSLYVSMADYQDGGASVSYTHLSKKLLRIN